MVPFHAFAEACENGRNFEKSHIIAHSEDLEDDRKKTRLVNFALHGLLHAEVHEGAHGFLDCLRERCSDAKSIHVVSEHPRNVRTSTKDED